MKALLILCVIAGALLAVSLGADHVRQAAYDSQPIFGLPRIIPCPPLHQDPLQTCYNQNTQTSNIYLTLTGATAGALTALTITTLTKR